MPAATFDGVNLYINTPAGVTEMDAQEDFYEPWKVFLKTPGAAGFSNLSFPQLFRPIAGDNITATSKYAGMFFMQNQNGWRLRLPDENITLTITGNFALQDPTVPFFTPRTGKTGAILGLAEFVASVQTGISGLTAEESITFAQFADIEGGLDIRAVTRLVLSAVQGILSGAEPASTTIKTKSLDGLKDRLIVTRDINGNRTLVVRDSS